MSLDDLECYDADYDDDLDYDEDEEEGENPMTMQEKKFYVTDASCGNFYATKEEAQVVAKRKAAADRDGDPYMVLQSVEYAQSKTPDVDVIAVN